MQINVDRHECLPWGLNGGSPGQPNRAYIQKESGADWELVLKRDDIRLSSDARVRLFGGGGGIGEIRSTVRRRKSSPTFATAT